MLYLFICLILEYFTEQNKTKKINTTVGTFKENKRKFVEIGSNWTSLSTYMTDHFHVLVQTLQLKEAGLNSFYGHNEIF